jgi:hypothetical protein
MRIDIVIAEWGQACCGVPFSVGAEGRWKVWAEEPPSTSSDAPTRFIEEHHGETPDHIPHWEVTGVVSTITGVRYPLLPVPGQARTFTPDYSNPESVALDAVEKSADTGFSEFVVGVEVADDAALPSHLPRSDRSAQRQSEELTATLNRDRRNDEVGQILEALTDDAQARFTDIARVTRATDRSAVTIEPTRDGATAIHWARSASPDSDGIQVHAGDGDWRLDATVESAQMVRYFVDAASSGRIEERVIVVDDEPASLETVVHGPDGHVWTATVPVQAIRGMSGGGMGGGADNGVRMMAGNFWTRIERGEHQYTPWRANE